MQNHHKKTPQRAFRRMIFVLILLVSALASPQQGMAQTQSKQDAHLRDLIEQQLSETTIALGKINTSINQTQEKMAELEEALQTLRKQEDGLKTLLSENIQKHHLAMASLARLERQPLRALLTYDAFKVQPQRQPILAIARKAMNQRVEENREKLADLLQITHQKEIHQGQLTMAQKHLENHRTELASLQEKQRQLLTLPPHERRAFEKQTRSVAKLGDLEKLLDMSNALTGITPPESLDKKGENLPLQGIITTRFGQPDPQTGIVATGVKIEGVAGQTVKALQDGRILYAGPFKGFGFLVIMEHKNQMHSLYGGMQETKLDVGSYIAGGSALGTLPERDAPQLYLEVRHKGKPSNPQKWLRNEG